MDWPRTGDTLAQDLVDLTFQSEPLIEGLLYKNTVWMLAADPGTGKSVIATQLALSLTSATPLFGHFVIPKPRTVYYLQLEGAYAESIERMRLMSRSIKIDHSRLVWDSYDGINIMRQGEAKRMITRMEPYRPDVLIIDPLYMLGGCAGGLSKEEPAAALAAFSNEIKAHFGCANVLIHHTSKQTYATDGKKIAKDDPFYGSQWIKAHLDVSYHFQSTDPRTGRTSRLRNTKSRGMNVEKVIDLHFDPDTYTCYVERGQNDHDVFAKISTFIKQCKMSGKTTDVYEVSNAVCCSVVYLKQKSSIQRLTSIVDFVSVPGKRTLWKPK